MTMSRAPRDSDVEADVHALAAGTSRDPHRVLGVHRTGHQVVVRTWRPGASTATLAGRPMRRIHDAGVFEVLVDTEPAPGYAVSFGWDGGGEHTVVDPWPFWPTLGELDLHDQLACRGAFGPADIELDLLRRLGRDPDL